MTAPIKRVTGFVFGSWLATGFAAALLILPLAGVAWIASTGRLADPQHLNIPLVHPWPPAGYYVNPFNPNDRSDLISTAEANVVKTDYLRDATLEDDALGRNDPEPLERADTGNRYRVLRDLMNQRRAQGLVFRSTSSSIERQLVGRLPDPNDASVTWCVEEAGTATEETVAVGSGEVVRRRTYRYNDRFWLAKVGDRWLITDALIRVQPVQ